MIRPMLVAEAPQIALLHLQTLRSYFNGYFKCQLLTKMFLLRGLGEIGLRVRWKVRAAACLAYVVLLTWLLLAPAATVVKWYPAWIPFQHADKALHFLLFGGLVLLARFAFPDPRHLTVPGWLVPVLALAYGAAIEVTQGLLVQYGRSFEWSDIAANGLGAAGFWFLSVYLLAEADQRCAGSQASIRLKPDCGSGIRTEPLAANLIGAAVDIHLEAFPNFFLSFLGPRFLREFYASFLADPVGMGFVACDADLNVFGVVVGPLDPRGYFKRLLKHRWWAFCLASTGAVLKRPSCLPRLFRAVFYRGEAPAGPVRALLSSIAVVPTAQGRGVGRALVERWVEEARNRGASGCYLTTDGENNDAVNAFYRSLGWKLEATDHTPEGRKMNRYGLDF